MNPYAQKFSQSIRNAMLDIEYAIEHDTFPKALIIELEAIDYAIWELVDNIEDYEEDDN